MHFQICLALFQLPLLTLKKNKHTPTEAEENNDTEENNQGIYEQKLTPINEVKNINLKSHII